MSSVSAPRKQAPRLARPAARYRTGQVPKGAGALASDSDEDEDEQLEAGQDAEEGDIAIEDIGGDEDEDEGGLEVRKVEVGAGKVRGMNVALRDVNISKEGRVIVAGKDEVGRTEVEQGKLALFAWDSVERR